VVTQLGYEHLRRPARGSVPDDWISAVLYQSLTVSLLFVQWPCGWDEFP